jgi:alpha-glucuronidase
MADALNHREAANEAARIEATLAENITRFVTLTGWSYYGLNVHGHRYISSVNYHRQNILGIGIVVSRTGSEVLSAAAQHWRNAFERLRVRSVNAFAKGAQVVWLRDIKGLPLHLG